MLDAMARGSVTIFIECRRCGHKGQREVEFLPLPPDARWRCSNCRNRDPGSIKVWHTGGSSSARIISFPKGSRRS
jgi:predicted nucleic-acid-binding Zn-ribbon protein